MKQAKLNIALWGLALAAATAGQARADWDKESQSGFDPIIYLDVDNDIDRTEVDLVDDDDEVDVYIREYVDGELVNSDHFDYHIHEEYTTTLIYGGEHVDVVTVDPAVSAKVSVMVLLGGGDDIGIGGNWLSGGKGNDRLFDGLRIYGMEDDDFIKAGPLTYFINGGDGDDNIYAQLSQQIVSIDAGEGDDLVIGNNLRNSIHGGPGDDLISGEGGDDHLYGDEGVDWIVGGAGQDTLDPGPWERKPEGVYGSSGADRFLVSRINDYYNDYDRSEGDR